MQQPWSVGGKDERVDKQLGQNAQRIIERNMLGSYAQNERESGKNRLVYHTERLLLFLSVFKESVDPPGTWALKRWWKNAGVDNEKHWAKYARALMLKIKDTYIYISHRGTSPHRIVNCLICGFWFVQCISLEAWWEGWTGVQTTRTNRSEKQWAKYGRGLMYV